MEPQSIPAPDGFPYLRRVRSALETADLGQQVAALLNGGEILLLNGPLGTGKTCFIQGLCRGLDVQDDVVSPTFTLVNTYTGHIKVHHLDFYRVEQADSLADIGVPDLLDEVWDGRAVLLVEWPEPLLPELGPEQPRIELLALPGEGADDRIWHLRGIPEVPPAWIRLFPKVEDPTC